MKKWKPWLTFTYLSAAALVLYIIFIMVSAKLEESRLEPAAGNGVYSVLDLPSILESGPIYKPGKGGVFADHYHGKKYTADHTLLFADEGQSRESTRILMAEFRTSAGPRINCTIDQNQMRNLLSDFKYGDRIKLNGIILSTDQAPLKNRTLFLEECLFAKPQP